MPRIIVNRDDKTKGYDNKKRDDISVKPFKNLTGFSTPETAKFTSPANNMQQDKNYVNSRVDSDADILDKRGRTKNRYRGSRMCFDGI